MRHMPAWIIVTAAAAVLLALWAAYVRRWWHALRYSMRRARHLADRTQTEVIPGAEYLPYAPVGGTPPWPLADWREQTRVELSPEALAAEIAWLWPPVDEAGYPCRAGDFMLNTGDLLAAPPDELYDDDELAPSAFADAWLDRQRADHERMRAMIKLPPPADPGPGDGLASSSPPPGPDQELCAHCGRPALGYARGYGNERLCHHEDRDCYHRVTVWGERLADTGDVAAAHEAHPSPDWLEAQMAELYAWVRAVVPQVTGWSVGA